MQGIEIRKKSGEVEIFDVDKLRRSLSRSGASKIVIDEIVESVSRKLYNGMPTFEIYNLAFKLLEHNSRPTAARYKLKEALFELGPSGFPFEIYVAEIIKQQGFRTKVGKVVNGKCVSHEVDVFAVKEGVCRLVECKFHNDDGRKTNVHVPLYIHARFNDIANSTFALQNKYRFEGWIVTNTRFTDDAIKYGECAGVHLVGWDYPKEGSLKQLIDIAGLHPITCLTSLDKLNKDELLEKGVVLCRELHGNKKWLKKLPNHSAVESEIHELCQLK